MFTPRNPDYAGILAKRTPTYINTKEFELVIEISVCA